MNRTRKKIWDLLEGDSKIGSVYNIVMTIVIVFSLIPLAFKDETTLLNTIDYITVTVFIVDYILRWITIDFRLLKGKKSFLMYPVTPWALLDLICILPSFKIIMSWFRILKVARLFRTMRVFRSLKLLRESKNIEIIINVLKKQSRALLTVSAMAVGYVLVIALVMFNVETETFDNFFHAIYWATISLTTIGYGDVFPQSMTGQCITIISAFVGVAVIAMPSGIIASGFMDEISGGKSNDNQNYEIQNDTSNYIGRNKLMDSNYLEELMKITNMRKEDAMKFWDIYYGIIEHEIMGYDELGYSFRTEDGRLSLVPINALVALELYKRNVGEIYRVYSDGTEGVVYDLKDIISHADDGGLFAIEVY